MEWIMMLGFCAYDMQLYLNSHPDDKDAIEYFQHCNELYQNAKHLYQEKFASLVAGGNNSSNEWDWACTPMPWERGM